MVSPWIYSANRNQIPYKKVNRTATIPECLLKESRTTAAVQRYYPR